MAIAARPRTPKMPDQPLPVICLAGPTGAGKTALSLLLAQELGCEIVNTDSRQVYSDFPIITAQPDSEDFKSARHHLYGFLPTANKISAGQWAKKAAVACRQIIARGKIPLLTGGTGFYFEAILHGLAEIPSISCEIGQKWANRINAEGCEQIYALLLKVDPGCAAKIHAHDRQRIQRALEVHEATGKTLSWWHEQSRQRPLANGPLIFLNVALESLTPQLSQRIEKMLEKGAIAEAEKAQKNCADPDSPGWSGIGCAELLAHINGRISLAECKTLWLANTRAYAKRQLTWFRGRKNAIPVTSGQSGEILKIVKQWNAKNWL